MKVATDLLKSKVLKSHAGIAKCSYDEIYESIDELKADMMKIDLKAPICKLPRGYEYIQSFQRYILTGKELTEKQTVQLKRLASEIAYAVHVLNNTGGAQNE